MKGEDIMQIEIDSNYLYKIRIEMVKCKITYLAKEEKAPLEKTNDEYKNVFNICVFPDNLVRIYCKSITIIPCPFSKFIDTKINCQFIKAKQDIPIMQDNIWFIFCLCNNIHWGYGYVLYSKGLQICLEDRKIPDEEYLMFVVYEDDSIEVFNYE